MDINNVSNDTLTQIEELPEVKRIWPAAYYTRAISGEAAVVGTAADLPASPAYQKWTTHNDTGVAAVQAKGIRGAGISIAFVDTGMDYNHPALGGGYGPGYKIEIGYDLVGKDYVAGGDLVPDGDPMDCLGHGTHTAGIAASMDALVPGVAPDAKLRAYKIFGCQDGTLEDNVIAGFLRAFGDGADVISASIGSAIGFPESPLGLVAARIVDSGVFVSIAAGNSGISGPFYTSNGPNGLGTMGVASVEAHDYVGYEATAYSSSGESRVITYLSAEMVAFGFDGNKTIFVPDNYDTITGCDWDKEDAPSMTDSLYMIK